MSTGSMAGVRCVFQRKERDLNNEKEYIEFLSELKLRVEKRFDGKVKGEICSTEKNNGVTVTGLMLKGEQERVAPNFYLNRQFHGWMCGKQSLEEIEEMLCTSYEEEVKKNGTLVSQIAFSWEEFQKNVFMRLVNREKNEKQLEKLPYMEFLDLAVVYYYSVPVGEETLGTMVITKEHLELLGITQEELHQTALKNEEQFQPVKIRCMEEVVYELGKRLGVNVQETEAVSPFLHVLTNSRGLYGAVAMINQEKLEHYARQINNSFYLLPSSIHEVILVPASNEISLEYFADMVREINQTQVDATEVLSDSIYFYDKKISLIRRVA